MLKHISIIYILLSFAKLYAQEPISYSTKQGLLSNHVYDIQEDADGFMWFATNRGLVKHDGETFKTFTIQDGLPNNDTWSLELDYQGRLWYFSKSAYQGYIKNDSIFKFQTPEKEVHSPRMVSKNKNTLWYYSQANVVTLKDNELVNLYPYSYSKIYEKSNDIAIEHGVSNNTIAPFINPTSQEIIYLLKDKFLFYNYKFNLKKVVPNISSVDFTNGHVSMHGILPNNIYFRTNNTDINFLNLTTKQVTSLDFKSIDPTIKSLDYIKCKAIDNEIQVSIPGYLFVFNNNLELIHKHSFLNNLPNLGSYKDSRGNIWLRNFTNGVKLLPNTQLQSHYYLENKKVQKVTNIDSSLFVGIQQDGFYKLNKQTNTIETIVKLNNPHSEIYQIKKDPISKEILLVSGSESFNYKDLKVLKVNVDSNSKIDFLNLTNFKVITRFKKFDYYYNGHNLFKTNPTTKRATIVGVNEGLSTSAVFNNRLFYGGTDGLHELVKDSIVKHQFKNQELNISINTLTSTDNLLFIGTNGRGVIAYNNEDNIQHIKATDGLSIQRIIKKDSVLWLASQHGVKKVVLNINALNQSKITNSFYESDGLLLNNTNDIHIRDSILYAASDLGLAKLNVNNSIYKKQPKIFFKTESDTINYLKGDRDNISLTFSLQDYINQDNVKYHYRLLPSQKQWVKTETKTLNFTNLSPKIYTLEVKATDQHNNTVIAKQHLNLVPEWWQHWYSVLGFVIICVFILLFFLQKAKQKIKKSEQDKAQKEKRVAGLELQALRSQMNPHFVHNSLNAIQYYIQRKEVELSENYLSKFSQLIRLFFEYSRRQTITIEEELELLTNYLEIEKLRFEEKLSYYIKVCEKINVEDQLIPSMLLQPIVENAVNHGLFHKKSNGIIGVEFVQINEDAFQVTINDDGIGINKAKTMFKASSKNYQSNSSKVLRERLDLLNLGNDWHIDYKIEDVSKTKKDKTGTIVTLIFKQLKD